MTRKQALFLKALGVKLNQKFTCDFTEDGVYVIREDKDNFLKVYSIKENGEEVKVDSVFFYIFLHHDLHLVGDILDDEEKKYLEVVCKPFKDRIKHIRLRDFISPETLQLVISLDNLESIILPEFKLGEMYKGMNVGETYTLKELGLFAENSNKEKEEK